jgi:ribonucleotide reductase beta subunit family protein with ferritin-like domain
MEPLLTPNPTRFTLFPIQNHKLYQKYKNHVAVFWTSEEVDLSKDTRDWQKLTANEQHFIKYILAFFAGSDGIVMENLATRFMREVQSAEARQFYSCQAFIESIHSELYSLLIDTYIEDREEKEKLFHAIEEIPCIAKKADWAKRWIDSPTASFATRLVGFAAVEGIFFSGAFCAIYWLKERGLMPGLTLSNEFIARDEGLHTDFACAMYDEIVHRLTEEEVHTIIKEAVEIEKEFITDALPCSLIGMNKALMTEYIEFVANRLLQQLGYKPLYEAATNPFDFMERISIEGKSNFFETRVSQYAKVGVGKEQSKMRFATDEDF